MKFCANDNIVITYNFFIVCSLLLKSVFFMLRLIYLPLFLKKYQILNQRMSDYALR